MMSLEVVWPPLRKEVDKYIRDMYGDYKILVNYGPKIVVRHKDLILKISVGVMKEVNMMNKARDIGLLVPKVYEFKTVVLDSCSYDIIVMEVVEGKLLSEVEITPDIRDLIIQDMIKIRGDPERFVYFTPGFDKGYYKFESVVDFYKSRIEGTDLESLFSECCSKGLSNETYFHHGDLYSSNIMITDQGLCYLDWGCAGQYPVEYIHALDQIFDWKIYRRDTCWGELEKRIRKLQ